MLAILSITAESGVSAPPTMKSDQDIALGWLIASIPAIDTTASTFSSESMVACSL